ncbi:hypothetical protein [Streptomyces mirabilis]|uniref:hypothetical protein n=1 Tax=Streptomyces mirabilis TaxID=68239 RepID=UPI003646926C
MNIGSGEWTLLTLTTGPKGTGPVRGRDGLRVTEGPAGSLARTGADTTAWILGGAGLLPAGGIGAVVAVRRHKDSGSEQDRSDETN